MKRLRLKRSRYEIAPIVGVSRQTVGAWLKLYAHKGTRELRAKKSGRPLGSGAYLSRVQIKEIKKAITDKTPDQLKFNFALWISEAVRLYIKRTYQIIPAPRTVRTYLQDWGFTPQNPTKQYYERDEASVQKWLKVNYPTIKSGQRKKMLLYFGLMRRVSLAVTAMEEGIPPKGKPLLKKSKAQ